MPAEFTEYVGEYVARPGVPPNYLTYTLKLRADQSFELEYEVGIADNDRQTGAVFGRWEASNEPVTLIGIGLPFLPHDPNRVDHITLLPDTASQLLDFIGGPISFQVVDDGLVLNKLELSSFKRMSPSSS